MSLIESIVPALVAVLYIPLYPFVVGLNLLYS